MSVFCLPPGAGAASRAQSEKHGKSMLINLLARALGMLLGVPESVQEGFPSCLLLGKNDISPHASLHPLPRPRPEPPAPWLKPVARLRAAIDSNNRTISICLPRRPSCSYELRKVSRNYLQGADYSGKCISRPTHRSTHFLDFVETREPPALPGSEQQLDPPTELDLHSCHCSFPIITQ